jgi:hypothetical protein
LFQRQSAVDWVDEELRDDGIDPTKDFFAAHLTA